MSLFDWLPFRKKKAEKTQEDLAEIRRMFATRYKHFSLLIRANTATHELMAELEEALRGFQPYGMHYVRALCSRISESVYEMIGHLNKLDHGSYEKLYDQFSVIHSKISPHLESIHHAGEGELVLSLSEVGRDQADLCGPKMATLGEAGNELGLKIPAGFVVTTVSFHKFMEKDGLEEQVDRLIQTADPDDREAMFQVSSKIMQLIINSDLPDDVTAAILEAYDSLCADHGEVVNVAVRSSALGEDSEGAAFAGQYRSILNIDRSSLILACKEVMASKYSLQAMAYRINRGIRDEDVAMSVGCIMMVEAASGGVAYSRSPMNIRDENISVYSVWGLPKAVVDGAAEADEFMVSRTKPMQVIGRHIADKEDRYVCDIGEGVHCVRQVNGFRAAPSLTDDQAVNVARQAVRIEEHFGSAQDIEWAMTKDGDLYLLQCRPLMQLDDSPEVVLQNSSASIPVLSGGRTASPGVGVGPAFPVRKDADTLHFPDGGVLILRQALPSRAALLSRCSAVITEQGGIAGHLANVAREFGVPALFGLKGALSRFKEGRIITVDADGRSVYDGLIEELLKEKPRHRLMRGSAVQASLRKAARHIVRLNLTDPDSPKFRPSNCKTMHDIMRYCHEMSVREMFEFGTKKEFVQSASRQLICSVPKQFWVLNLGDGITPEGRKRNDRCVLLEHITSAPMLALWEGMQAVPWEGPPAVHTQGLLSVMFEATINPDLNTTSPSHFSQKNYFMISKRYCCLQSRFGFHFCGVEALIGDRVSENYASLQFKGGAANLERRILRAKFVGEILDEFDFRVRIREDNLNARLEGLEHASMERRLKILGYLITHTRQLDMIMTNEAEVEKYKKKFAEDFKLFPAVQ
ncbi:PEP/pyruvate-binding domain-containing protein [Maridesulfovibrio zosterae]|uniref:PEP/pyruvate-binding domain-containing protein n=1 Tax=Maridesulfovibrio zosterae TaxID=82171 RepID=UPI0004126E40|nr:PEP/pyruvate-binding domain-containing protein [Maridesulfovibrio zosterae]